MSLFSFQVASGDFSLAATKPHNSWAPISSAITVDLEHIAEFPSDEIRWPPADNSRSPQQLSPTRMRKSTMTDGWVFLPDAVIERFHKGARLTWPLLVQETGRNQLLWAESADVGINWDERRDVNSGSVQTMGQTGTGAENRREEMSHITAVNRVLVKILLEQLHSNTVCFS